MGSVSHIRTGPLSRRSVLALGGLAATSAALAGCEATRRLEPDPAPTASGPPRPTVEQWYHAYSEEGVKQAVERYAADFQQASVQPVWREGEYDLSTAAALPTEAGPDVFEYANGPTIDMIRGGLVVDLTETVGAAAPEFQQSVIGRMTHEGRVWAIPQVVDTQVLVYRPSLLAAAGLEPPRTMDALLDAARSLTRRGTKGLFLGNRGGATHMGGPVLWSAGLDFLTDDNKFGFDEPRAADALRTFRELHDSGSTLRKAAAEWSDPGALVDGLAAMQFTGLWTFPKLVERLGDDVGVLPWPALDDMGNPSVPLGAYGACVSARASDVTAAKDFVRWLWVERDDHQLDFATRYGLHIPSRTSLVERAAALKSGPAAEAAAIAIEFGMPQSKLLWTAACGTAFEAMMTAVIAGADPRAEIRKVRTVVEAELKRVLS